MDIQPVFNKGNLLRKSKETLDEAFPYFEQVVKHLGKVPFEQLSSQKQRIMIESYSSLYLLSFFCHTRKEDVSYAEQMYTCAEKYFVKMPDDLDLYRICLTTLVCALMYQQSYNMLIRLYEQGGEKKELALEYLSAFVYEAEGLMSREMWFRYEKEYLQVLEDHQDYEAAYKMLLVLREQRGEKREYALKKLITKPYAENGIITPAEYEKYKQEYDRLI